MLFRESFAVQNYHLRSSSVERAPCGPLIACVRDGTKCMVVCLVWDQNKYRSLPMRMKILVSAGLLAGFVAQATAAEFYVIQDSSTKRCTVVDKRPTVKTETVVGENGRVYSTREEATTAMGKEKICTETH
jgi:hypothetical protein